MHALQVVARMLVGQMVSELCKLICKQARFWTSTRSTETDAQRDMGLGTKKDRQADCAVRQLNGKDNP